MGPQNDKSDDRIDIGSKVRIGQVTGVVEAVTATGVLDVRWDSGARSRVSPSELADEVEVPKRSDADRERGRREAKERRKAERDEQLKREWEQWRHRRSKLPPGQQRGPMMELGQRECRYEYCGRFFEPSTLRQRFCKPAHEQAQRRLKNKA
jgi:hypothetical protein